MRKSSLTWLTWYDTRFPIWWLLWPPYCGSFLDEQKLPTFQCPDCLSPRPDATLSSTEAGETFGVLRDPAENSLQMRL